MRIIQTHLIAFSPCGTTLAVLQALSAGLGRGAALVDMTLPTARNEQHTFGPDDLVVFGVPVYGGRLPTLVEEVFASVSGAETPALLVAVYGNRDYEDALLEMQHGLITRGFVPFAAIAAVAEHCMAPAVGAGRPDTADKEVLARFGGAVAKYLWAMDHIRGKEFMAPGNFPYGREPLRIGVPPRAEETCTRCGQCATMCPAGAIPPASPDTADPERCIVCMACVVRCPLKARTAAHPTFAQSVARLQAACAVRREPELFPEGLL